MIKREITHTSLALSTASHNTNYRILTFSGDTPLAELEAVTAKTTPNAQPEKCNCIRKHQPNTVLFTFLAL